MGKVVRLHAERWIEGVYEAGTPRNNLRVDVSTKGNVRFTIEVSDGRDGAALSTVVSMEGMAKMTEALSVAYKEDDG